jgi:hypothetical protein
MKKHNKPTLVEKEIETVPGFEMVYKKVGNKLPYLAKAKVR